MAFWLLIAGLGFTALLQFYLSLRQIKCVAGHRNDVPPEFAHAVSLEQHKKAADYTLAHRRLAIVEIVVNPVLTVCWLLFGIRMLEGALESVSLSPVLVGGFLIVGLTVIGEFLDLPLRLLNIFGIESRFGFNRTGPGLFVLDWLKSLAFSAVVVFALSVGVLSAMARLSGNWWVWAWLGFIAFVGVMMTIYPVFIAPLFNKFAPLPEGDLKARVSALLERCGFQSKGLFVMDGSKRSSHGNAYFTGFGKAKRIVFYDTLIEKLSVDEIEAVLAHELGHFVHRDILIGFLRMAVLSLGVFAWFGFVAKEPWVSAAAGVPPSDAVGLLIAMMFLTPLNALFAPIANAFSTRAEYRADAYAKDVVGSAATLSSGLLKLSLDSASTLTPDPLYVLFHYSHPPLPLRLARLRSD